MWIGCQSVENIQYEIVGIAFLIGASSSAHQTCSMSMIARLIGPNIGNIILYFISFNSDTFYIINIVQLEVVVIRSRIPMYLIIFIESSGFLWRWMAWWISRD